MQERFALREWETLETGAPRCNHALVALDCEVADMRKSAPTAFLSPTYSRQLKSNTATRCSISGGLCDDTHLCAEPLPKTHA